MVVTDKGEYIDTDYDGVFYHKDGSIMSEDDAINAGMTEPEDGEFSG